MMEAIKVRSGLPFTKKAIESGKFTFGVLGGSISENKVPHNWTVPFMTMLNKQYEGLTIVEENAAIGSTGSIVGLARMDRDIISRNPDLVFVEYAVNDWNTPREQRVAAVEGIIRRLINYGKCDIVLVYTFQKEMYPYLMQDELPPTVADYEAIADHYGLNSAFVGKYVFDMNKAGLIKWHEWLPDNLHPRYRGSGEYARCIWEVITGGLSNQNTDNRGIAPLNPACWENAVIVPTESLPVKWPFYISRYGKKNFVDHVIHTSAIGAEFEFNFEGTGAAFVFDFGRQSAEFDIYVDGELQPYVFRERPDWLGENDWLLPTVVGGLKKGKHTIKMITKYGYGAGCDGTEFDLAFIFTF